MNKGKIDVLLPNKLYFVIGVSLAFEDTRAQSIIKADERARTKLRPDNYPQCA